MKTTNTFSDFLSESIIINSLFDYQTDANCHKNHICMDIEECYVMTVVKTNFSHFHFEQLSNILHWWVLKRTKSKWLAKIWKLVSFSWNMSKNLVLSSWGYKNIWLFYVFIILFLRTYPKIIPLRISKSLRNTKT